MEYYDLTKQNCNKSFSTIIDIFQKKKKVKKREFTDNIYKNMLMRKGQKNNI